MKIFQYQKLNKKNYGRIALLGLLIGGIKTTVQIQLPLYILMITDILVIAGFISGLIWILKSIKQKSISSKKYCERCGDADSSCVYNKHSTDVTRDFYKIAGYHPFDEPLNLCLGCVTLHEFFIGGLTMLLIEKNQKFGRFKEVELVEKDWGDSGLFVLALLYFVNDNKGSIESVQKILNEKSFEEIKPWLEEQIKHKFNNSEK